VLHSVIKKAYSRVRRDCDGATEKRRCQILNEVTTALALSPGARCYGKFGSGVVVKMLVVDPLGGSLTDPLNRVAQDGSYAAQSWKTCSSEAPIVASRSAPREMFNHDHTEHDKAMRRFTEILQFKHSAPFVNPPNSFVSHPMIAPFCPAAITLAAAVAGFWNPFHCTAKRLLIPDSEESA